MTIYLDGLRGRRRGTVNCKQTELKWTHSICGRCTTKRAAFGGCCYLAFWRELELATGTLCLNLRFLPVRRECSSQERSLSQPGLAPTTKHRSLLIFSSHRRPLYKALRCACAPRRICSLPDTRLRRSL